MTQEAMKLALEALEEIALAGMSGSGQESEEGMTAWHAHQAWKFIGIAARALDPIRIALAAPVASTAKGAIMGAAYNFRDAHISGSTNLKRSAHAALESAVDAALAAPVQQEPVAWLDPWTRSNVTTDYDAYGEHGIPIYTSPQPAQRKPLTDEEILNFGPGQPDAVWSYEDQLYFARAIEAKLKEKNT